MISEVREGRLRFTEDPVEVRWNKKSKRIAFMWQLDDEDIEFLRELNPAWKDVL